MEDDSRDVIIDLDETKTIVSARVRVLPSASGEHLNLLVDAITSTEGPAYEVRMIEPLGNNRARVDLRLLPPHHQG